MATAEFFYETVLQCPGQRIIKHNILELNAFGIDWCCGKLKAQYRLEFVDHSKPGISPVMVGLIHQKYEVGQFGKITEI